MSLPSADDLFRPTAAPEDAEAAPAGAAERRPADSAAPAGTREQADTGTPTEPENPSTADSSTTERSSGRVRHDEKMTVYVTADELLDLEHARLLLRRAHGVAVDRGRLVREAVAIALADLETRGEDSLIVRRLTGS